MRDGIYEDGETLDQMLSRLMKEKNLTPAALSREAEIDRRIIYNISHRPDYCPRTDTLAYIALALHLSSEDTDELLRSAGRAFTNTNIFDVVVSACIANEVYDRNEVEEAINRCSNTY